MVCMTGTGQKDLKKKNSLVLVLIGQGYKVPSFSWNEGGLYPLPFSYWFLSVGLFGVLFLVEAQASH